MVKIRVIEVENIYFFLDVYHYFLLQILLLFFIHVN